MKEKQTSKFLTKLVMLCFLNFLYITICQIKLDLFKIHKCGADLDGFVPIDILVDPNQKNIEDKWIIDDNEVDEDGFKNLNIYLDLENIKHEIKEYNLEKYEDIYINGMKKEVKTTESLIKIKPLKYDLTFTGNKL